MKWNKKDEKHINTLSELGNLSGNWKDKALKSVRVQKIGLPQLTTLTDQLQNIQLFKGT